MSSIVFLRCHRRSQLSFQLINRQRDFDFLGSKKMKRQRNVVEGSNRKGATTRLIGAKPTTMSMSKKKVKREVEIKEEDVGEQRRKGSDDSASRFVAAAPENMLGWEEYCPWLGGAVDEQMSWGSFWLPFWDVEFICEAYTTFFGDVVWDDDIWNVMGIKEVPKP